MENYIIDTNVPLKATDTQSTDMIDRLCAQRCFTFIKDIMSSDGIVVLEINDKNFFPSGIGVDHSNHTSYDSLSPNPFTFQLWDFFSKNNPVFLAGTKRKQRK